MTKHNKSPKPFPLTEMTLASVIRDLDTHLNLQIGDTRVKSVDYERTSIFENQVQVVYEDGERFVIKVYKLDDLESTAEILRNQEIDFLSAPYDN